jgi:hypothetical protein
VGGKHGSEMGKELSRADKPNAKCHGSDGPQLPVAGLVSDCDTANENQTQKQQKRQRAVITLGNCCLVVSLEKVRPQSRSLRQFKS